MLYKGIIIRENTVSIIVPENDNGTIKGYTLTVFDKYRIVFEKTYNTRLAAERVSTFKINRLFFKNH